MPTSGELGLVAKDNQIRPIGVFFCDGQPISRSIVDERHIPTHKPMKCGYCGVKFPRGVFNCPRCSKDHSIPEKLPYRRELSGRVWQANIPPAEKPLYPLITFPSSGGGHGHGPGLAGGTRGAASSIASSSAVSTVSCEMNQPPPTVKPNMHTHPEWAGALVVFNYSPEKKSNKQGTSSSSSASSVVSSVATTSNAQSASAAAAAAAAVDVSKRPLPASIENQLTERHQERKIAISKRKVDPEFAKFVRGENCHPTGNFVPGDNRENKLIEKVHSMVLPKHKQRSTLERSLVAEARDVRAVMQRDMTQTMLELSRKESEKNRQFLRTKRFLGQIEQKKIDAARAMTYGDSFVDVENIYSASDYSSLEDHTLSGTGDSAAGAGSRPGTGHGGSPPRSPDGRLGNSGVLARILGRSTSPKIAAAAAEAALVLIDKQNKKYAAGDTSFMDSRSNVCSSTNSEVGSESPRKSMMGSMGNDNEAVDTYTGTSSPYRSPRHRKPYTPSRLRRFGKQDAPHHFTQFDRPIIGMPKK